MLRASWANREGAVRCARGGRAPHSRLHGSGSHTLGARAFTRAELLVILAVLSLLALIVLPALANTRPRSARVICANNLRQIGVGMQLWGNDHDDQPPWEVRLEQGGTYQHPLAPNTWLHFAWLSNELASPKLLLCPADSGKAAYDFTGDPLGGYLHPNFANRATSY
jgi:competence protein ComGC